MLNLVEQKKVLKRIEKNIDPKLVIIAKGWALARIPNEDKMLTLRKNIKGTVPENHFKALMEKMLKIEHLTSRINETIEKQLVSLQTAS